MNESGSGGVELAERIKLIEQGLRLALTHFRPTVERIRAHGPLPPPDAVFRALSAVPAIVAIYDQLDDVGKTELVERGRGFAQHLLYR